MFIWVCRIGKQIAIELVDTGELFMVNGWDDLEHKRSPTESELSEIYDHQRYMSQLLGGSYGS
jgi:hypothetical protein